MLGLPRLDLLDESPAEDIDAFFEAGDGSATAVTGDGDPSAKPVSAPQPAAAAPRARARARVRYDSADEPLPVIQRRRKAVRTLALLALLAALWLGYRVLTLNG